MTLYSCSSFSFLLSTGSFSFSSPLALPSAFSSSDVLSPLTS